MGLAVLTLLVLGSFLFSRLSNESPTLSLRSFGNRVFPPVESRESSLKGEPSHLASSEIERPTPKDDDKNEEETCDGKNERVVTFEDGREYCEDESTIVVPQEDTRKLGEALLVAVNDFYEGNETISFEHGHIGDLVFAFFFPPENIKTERKEGVYWVSILDEKGGIIGIIEADIEGKSSGKEYIELRNVHPYGTAIITKGSWEPSEKTLESIQKEHAYRQSAFPPVTDMLATSFLNDYLREEKLKNGISRVDRKQYQGIYDLNGYEFPVNNLWHSFVLSFKTGDEQIVFVNAFDGRVVDDGYLRWLSDKNQENRKHSDLGIFPKEGDDIGDAPQKPRLAEPLSPM